VLLGPTIVRAGADGCLVFASYNMNLTGEGSTFLSFSFLVCCMLGEAQVPSQCWLRMLCTVSNMVPHLLVTTSDVQRLSEHRSLEHSHDCSKSTLIRVSKKSTPETRAFCTVKNHTSESPAFSRGLSCYLDIIVEY
jgi:hypothetical protein